MKTTRISRALVGCAGICLIAVLAGKAPAQDEESAMFGGNFLENLIVERDMAFRLRAEVQLTEDDDELIEQDPEYAAFPSRLYSAEAKVFHNSRTTMSVRWAVWENDQDMNLSRWTAKVRTPLSDIRHGAVSHLTLKVSRFEGVGGADDRQYLYLGIDRSLGDDFYTYLQYRHSTQGGEFHGGQLYEYLSWRPTSRFRFGEQAAISKNKGSDTGPWYVQVFATVFLVKDKTALRFAVQHYESSSDLNYQEYNAYAYQAIGNRLMTRLNYRLYDDNGGLTSHAYGAKLKCYLSERIDAHVGYRYYDHDQGADFHTAYTGLGILL